MSTKVTILIGKGTNTSDWLMPKKVFYTKEDGYEGGINVVIRELNNPGANIVGKIAESEEVLLDETESIKNVYENLDETGTITLTSQGEEYFGYERFQGELLEDTEMEDETEGFRRISGTFSMFPDKYDFLEKIALQQNQKVYAQRVEGAKDSMVYWDNKDEICKIGILENVPEEVFEGKASVPLKVEKVTPDGAVYVSIAKEAEVAEKKKKKTQALIETISKMFGLSENEVWERMDYLMSNDISGKSAFKIFKSYVKYKDDVEAKVPKKPRIPFIDNNGILKQAIANINIGSHLMLEGLMGTGKNVLAETLAWLYKRPLYEFSMNSGVNNMDLLGSMSMENGNVVFKRSNIIEAFEEGGVIVLDEFNIALPHVLSVFNSLLDERRRMNVPGYKAVDAHKNFIAIGTQNPDYIGTFEGNQATLNRFYKISFTEGADIEEIIKRSVEMDNNDDFLQTANWLCEKIILGVKDGAIAQECINIRGFIKAAKLYKEEGFGVKEALQGAVVGSIGESSDRDYVNELLKNI